MNDAIQYIYSLTNFEKKMEKGAVEYSLDNIRNALEIFDNPHNKIKSIHIAGTKGKGSTAIMISTLLVSLKYNVSTFTSPHIGNINERITNNLNPISNRKFVELTNLIKEKSEKNNLILTTFEFLFLIFLLFSLELNVDYSVIECGLGGRLDTTNVITPIVSVITSISYDHIDILGESIEDIAREKGGIIKESIPVVVSKQPFKKAKNVIKYFADIKKSKFYDVEKIVNIKLKKEKFIEESKKGEFKETEFDRQYFDFLIFGKKFKSYSINLSGKHQLYNLAASMIAVSIIHPTFLDTFSDNSDNKDLFFNIRGRIEIVSNDPLIVVDVAHNGDSIDKLVNTLKDKFKGIRWRVIIGVAKNKDYDRILKGLKKITKDIIITNISGEKEGDINTLLNRSKHYFKDINYIDNNFEAFEFAIRDKSPLLITGSFYIVSPFLEFLLAKSDYK